MQSFCIYGLIKYRYQVSAGQFKFYALQLTLNENFQHNTIEVGDLGIAGKKNTLYRSSDDSVISEWNPLQLDTNWGSLLDVNFFLLTSHSTSNNREEVNSLLSAMLMSNSSTFKSLGSGLHLGLL